MFGGHDKAEAAKLARQNSGAHATVSPDGRDAYIVTDLMQTDLHQIIASPQPLTGVSVELAPQGQRPKLTVDPHELTTHNLVMRKSLAE